MFLRLLIGVIGQNIEQRRKLPKGLKRSRRPLHLIGNDDGQYVAMGKKYGKVLFIGVHNGYR